MIRRLFAAALLALLSGSLCGRLDAATAVLTRSGILYEVSRAAYGDLHATDNAAEARQPVLVLRTTTPGSAPVSEIVAGTLDSYPEGSASVEYDESTGTVFVLYSQWMGVLSNIHFALKRDGVWRQQDIDPNPGFFLSLNPRMLVTRQRYVDFDGNGGTVTKTRSILSLTWWEETGVASQARYAAVFVEDGVLGIDEVQAVNLNEVAGAAGPTPVAGLPFSSYQFPSLHRDFGGNGGVLVSFANLAESKQTTLRIGFPDDLTKLTLPDGSAPSPGTPYARGHFPIGKRAGTTPIPGQLDTNSDIGTVLTPGGLPIFYWEDVTTAEDGSQSRFVRYLSGDAAPGAAPMSLPVRGDFSTDRAFETIREFANRY